MCGGGPARPVTGLGLIPARSQRGGRAPDLEGLAGELAEPRFGRLVEPAGIRHGQGEVAELGGQTCDRIRYAAAPQGSPSTRSSPVRDDLRDHVVDRHGAGGAVPPVLDETGDVKQGTGRPLDTRATNCPGVLTG